MPTVRYTVIDGEVIAEKRNGVRRLYVPDPLGSTVALLGNSQAKTDTFTYWPYGEEASRTGTTPTPFRYVGASGYHRDASNRTYVRARVLRPDLGRWLMADPIGPAGGDWNLFRYADGCPTTLRDVSGLTPIPGVDYCGCLPKRWRECRPPLGPCPNGGSYVCVTCYGSDAPGGDAIGLPGVCGRRAPAEGDCAIDNHCRVCQPGEAVRIGGVGLVGPGSWPQCTVCDTGVDMNCGIDVFMPGPERGCEDRMKRKGYSLGTGWYCVQCAVVSYPTGDYPCYDPRPGRPIYPRRPRWFTA